MSKVHKMSQATAENLVRSQLATMANDPAPAQAAPAALDTRALRTFLQPVTVAEAKKLDPVRSIGHNCVLDEREPGVMYVEIGTDPEALAAMMTTDKGAKYLAKSKGERYPSADVYVNGERYFLTVTLQKHIKKA